MENRKPRIGGGIQTPYSLPCLPPRRLDGLDLDEPRILPAHPQSLADLGKGAPIGSPGEHLTLPGGAWKHRFRRLQAAHVLLDGYLIGVGKGVSQGCRRLHLPIGQAHPGTTTTGGVSSRTPLNRRCCRASRVNAPLIRNCATVDRLPAPGCGNAPHGTDR